MTASTISGKGGIGTRKFFRATLIATIVGSLFMFGCGDDSGNEEPTLILNGGDLTNGANDAWVVCKGACEGYAFKDGTFYGVVPHEELGSNVWFERVMGTYTTSDNIINLTFGNNPGTVMYDVSDNQLTIDWGDRAEVYTRRTGLIFVNEDNYMEFWCQGLVDDDIFDTVEECLDCYGDGDECIIEVEVNA